MGATVVEGDTAALVVGSDRWALVLIEKLGVGSFENFDAFF